MKRKLKPLRLIRFILILVVLILGITRVFSGKSSDCWFYKVDNLPVYHHYFTLEPEVEITPSEVEYLTQVDMELLASIVFAEANLESDFGQQLVVVTVLNRLHNGQWGDDIESVIFSPSQFCGVSNPRFGHYTEQNMDNAQQAVQRWYEGEYDGLKDVLYFHAHTMVDTKSYIARWNMEIVLVVGNHTFTKRR